MIDTNILRQFALKVKGWGNCNKAWLDTSEDHPAAVVGSIDDAGNEYDVAVIDCEQYFSPDSLDLAKFYAQANPAAILELLDRLEVAEHRLSIANKQLADSNKAAHSMASRLCGLHADDHEKISRDSVMELVTRWRSMWDTAMNAESN